MRYIRKKTSPQAFEEWKQTNKPSSWSALMNEPAVVEPGVSYYFKKDLRASLLAEQGHLCCYCQRQIENVESTVIEHIFPRNGVDKEQGKAKMFDYDNLMASCDGGSLVNRNKNSGTPSYPQYCDKSKGEKILPLSPLQPDIETRFTYTIIDDKLEIAGKDPEGEQTIEILNLNTPFLQTRRGEAIAGLLFKDVDRLEPISIEDAKKLLDSIQQNAIEKEDHLTEFLAIKVYYLQLFSGST